MNPQLMRKGRYETLVIGMAVQYIEAVMAKGYIVSNKNEFFLDGTIKFLQKISKISAIDWSDNHLDVCIRAAIENAKAYIAGNFRARELHPILVEIDGLVERNGGKEEKLFACFEEIFCWIKNSESGTLVPFNTLSTIIIAKFFLEHFVRGEHRMSAMKIFGILPAV